MSGLQSRTQAARYKTHIKNGSCPDKAHHTSEPSQECGIRKGNS